MTEACSSQINQTMLIFGPLLCQRFGALLGTMSSAGWKSGETRMRIVRAIHFWGLLSVSLLFGNGPEDKAKKSDHYLDDVSLGAFKFRSIGPALTSGRISDFAINSLALVLAPRTPNPESMAHCVAVFFPQY